VARGGYPPQRKGDHIGFSSPRLRPRCHRRGGLYFYADSYGVSSFAVGIATSVGGPVIDQFFPDLNVSSMVITGIATFGVLHLWWGTRTQARPGEGQPLRSRPSRLSSAGLTLRGFEIAASHLDGKTHKRDALVERLVSEYEFQRLARRVTYAAILGIEMAAPAGRVSFDALLERVQPDEDAVVLTGLPVPWTEAKWLAGAVKHGGKGNPQQMAASTVAQPGHKPIPASHVDVPRPSGRRPARQRPLTRGFGRGIGLAGQGLQSLIQRPASLHHDLRSR
jgi:hypothetical protein